MNQHSNDMTTKRAARLDAILESALDMLEANGLEGITLRKLAAQLDMKAPTLYWYFKDKRLLIDYMAEKILQKGFVDFRKKATDEQWQIWLTGTMTRLRTTMLAYRHGGSIVAGAHLGPARTLATIISYSVESLIDGGLSVEDANTISMTALHFTFGRVIEEQESPTREEAQKYIGTSVFEEYPYLKQLVTSNEFPEREFLRSLELIIGK